MTPRSRATDDQQSAGPRVNPGPLSGLKVVEFGNFIAAPTAGRLFADFGADVVKVERPGIGDELRRWRLHDGDTSLLFRTLNRNKRSVTLDLKTERGREIALQLIRRSDVVLENFRPGTLEKWGLSPAEIRRVNPDVILVRISGYGQTGPYRDRPGFGGVAEAVGGLRHLTGYPDQPPTRVGVSIADSVSALYAVIGALMALYQQGRGRAGEVVDVALYEGIYSLMESLTPDYDAFDVSPERSGTSLPGIVPSNTYLCQDGRYVVVSGNSDAIFRRLMWLIERPDLADDPALADNAGRVERRAEIDDAIGEWAGTRTMDEVLIELDNAGVPAGPIYTPADIAKDPHYAARGMHERHEVIMSDGVPTEVTFPGVVPKLTEHPGRTRWLGPDLGDHSDAVYAELGIDAAERSSLREQGVI